MREKETDRYGGEKRRTLRQTDGQIHRASESKYEVREKETETDRQFDSGRESEYEKCKRG